MPQIGQHKRARDNRRGAALAQLPNLIVPWKPQQRNDGELWLCQADAFQLLQIFLIQRGGIPQCGDGTPEDLWLVVPAPDGGITSGAAGGRQAIECDGAAGERNEHPVAARSGALQQSLCSLDVRGGTRKLPQCGCVVQLQFAGTTGRPLIPVDSDHTRPGLPAACFSLAEAPEQCNVMGQRQCSTYTLHIS